MKIWESPLGHLFSHLTVQGNLLKHLLSKHLLGELPCRVHVGILTLYHQFYGPLLLQLPEQYVNIRPKPLVGATGANVVIHAYLFPVNTECCLVRFLYSIEICLDNYGYIRSRGLEALPQHLCPLSGKAD